MKTVAVYRGLPLSAPLCLLAVLALPLHAAPPEASAGLAMANAESAPAPTEALRCDAPTGTRIRPARGSDCAALIPGVFGYGQDDLQRTGEINLADALRRLDPRFR